MKATGTIDRSGRQLESLELPAEHRAAWPMSLIVHNTSALLLALGIVGTLAIFLLQVALILDYTVDDAFISYRYAESLADGIGLVFN